MEQNEINQMILSGEIEVIEEKNGTEEKQTAIDTVADSTLNYEIYKSALETIRQIKKHTGTAPTYSPRDYPQQIVFYKSGATYKVYFNIDNSWQYITLGGEKTKGDFGGDGSDGALSISSGTTTIDCNTSAIVVKNYSSISITGTAKLAFSNKHANGTIVILKSQGNVTLTSSDSTMIALSGIGADGGSGGTDWQDGFKGLLGNGIIDGNFVSTPTIINYGTGGDADDGSIGGGPYYGGNKNSSGDRNAGYPLGNKHIYAQSNTSLYPRLVACGSGGGGGAGAGNSKTGGNGGAGGGALIIECGGALNFTGIIDVSGANGSNGDSTGGSNYAGGGGGGGASGMCCIIYNTLTDASGTIDSSGGAGGAGGGWGADVTNSLGVYSGSGGGGAGQWGGTGGFGGNAVTSSTPNDGVAGTDYGAGGGGGSASGDRAGLGNPSLGGTGGAGGASNSGLIIQNYYFA